MIGQEMKMFLICLGVNAFLLSPVRSVIGEENQLRTGAVLSLTGAAAVHGTGIQEGIEFAKHHLTKKGWKVEIDYQDDATEPKKTISAIEGLVASKFRFFIGPTWGILAEPAAPVLLRSGSLSLQPCNSSEFVKGNDRFFFFLPPVRNSEPVVRDWIKLQKISKVAIITATSPWGDLHSRIFRAAAEGAGASVVFEESFQYGDENTAVPILMTKLRTKVPDVILTTSSKDITALMVTHLERLHLSTKVLSPDLGDAVNDGLVQPKSQWVNGFFLRALPSTVFTEAFTEWKGTKPRKYADNAYDAILALAEAIAAVGADPAHVKAYFETKLDLEGASGRVRFDRSHDRRDGEYEVVEVVSLK